MKQSILILCIVACFLGVAGAQTAPRELGVRFSGVDFSGNNVFNLVYKKQKAENRFNRWRAAFGNIGYDNFNDDEDNVYFNFGAYYGIEKRRALSDRFTFNHGWEFGGNIGLNFSEANGGYQLGLAAGYVLGVQYNPAKPFFINLETIPGAGLSFSDYGDGEDSLIVQGNIGFNSLAAVTLGFRF